MLLQIKGSTASLSPASDDPPIAESLVATPATCSDRSSPSCYTSLSGPLIAGHGSVLQTTPDSQPPDGGLVHTNSNHSARLPPGINLHPNDSSNGTSFGVISTGKASFSASTIASIHPTPQETTHSSVLGPNSDSHQQAPTGATATKQVSAGLVVQSGSASVCEDSDADSSESEDGFSIPFDPESFGLSSPKCSPEVCASAVYSFRNLVGTMLGEIVQSLRYDKSTCFCCRMP